MKTLMKPSGARWALGICMAFGLGMQSVQAHKGSEITLIQLADTHGNLMPHAGIIKQPDGTERYVTRGGGLAKLKTLVDEIREENPNSLLLAVGDSTHGTAETLFTVGDAIMPALNAFGIDAFTPGNWDFGYGPAVFRNRFATFGPRPPLPPNIRVMADAYDGPGVTAATFPTIAANLYNVSPPLPPQLHHKRVLPPYRLFDVAGERIAVIGITAAIVPQQSRVFNIGLRFTQGTEELPGLIEEVKQQGAGLIVVLSELGLAQNIQIGREFPEVDVVFSAHTHEVTLGALLVTRDRVLRTDPTRERIGHRARHLLARNAAIVVETGEDLYLGRLDLKVRNGRIRDFRWRAIPVDDSVPEDPEMAALVADAEEPFVAGEDGIVERHSFLPGGFCPGGSCGDVTSKGIQLVDDLDTVVGYTDVLLARHDDLENVVNNFIADALREVALPLAGMEPQWATLHVLGMTNGFRFGTPILSVNEVPADAVFADGRRTGEITLRDLFSLFPIAPAVAVAEFSGKSIVDSLEGVLDAVYHRNPFLQRGGWYLGFSSNMHQLIDLDNRPFSSSGGRIVATHVAGVPIDDSRRYVLASCYPHGDSVSRNCRTFGGTGLKFLTLADPDDYASPIYLSEPVNTEGLVQGPRVKQVAPDTFVHATHLLRRYLDSLPGRRVTADLYALGRVQTVDSTRPGNPPVPAPVSAIDPTFIQPPEGAGPDFFGRISLPVRKRHD